MNSLKEVAPLPPACCLHRTVNVNTLRLETEAGDQSPFGSSLNLPQAFGNIKMPSPVRGGPGRLQNHTWPSRMDSLVASGQTIQERQESERSQEWELGPTKMASTFLHCFGLLGKDPIWCRLVSNYMEFRADCSVLIHTVLPPKNLPGLQVCATTSSFYSVRETQGLKHDRQAL